MNKKYSAIQSGFTLVELMVGLIIGLFLTGALYQTFISSQQTAIMSKGINNIQENARFGLHFINKAVRDSGYSGCLSKVINNLKGNPSNILSNKNSLYGWNYAGTASEDKFTLPNANSLQLTDGLSKWEGAGSLPSFMSGRVARASDVLTFKSFAPMNISVQQHTNVNSAITTVGNDDLPPKSIVLIGDCNNAELFENIGSRKNTIDLLNTGGKINNRITQWRRKYTKNDKIHVYQHTFFYVGQGSNGTSSLFRFSTSLPLDAVTSSIFAKQSQEIVDGIESLQLLFGEDKSGDKNPNNYASAHQINNWDNVVSVKVGLLIRSLNFTDTDNNSGDVARVFTLLDSIKITHPKKDSILRYAINTTVKLRNRGLDDNMTYHVCDSVDDAGVANGIPTCT